MKIHLIWAQEQNGGIGKNGELPWHISEDMKNFKKLTSGSIVLMGRITWESLPVKPLSKRRNIVLSSRQVADVECYTTTEKCLEALNHECIEELFVIGGSSLYHNFIHRADELHITLVNEFIEGIDTYFPITLAKIQYKFDKIEERRLTNNAVYYHWVKK